MKILCLAGLLLFSYPCFSQNGYKVYNIFNGEGKKVRFEKVLKKSKDADIVLFGEQHNDPVVHWLQLQMVKGLYDTTGRGLVLGAEMFETDNQLILNEYITGLIDDKRFESGARLWNNYSTDYKPLVLAARERKIPFIATNIPRRYANLVSKGGFEALNLLSEDAKGLIAPLPVPYDEELPGYKKMLEMGMAHGRMSENFPKAQAIKDATMAYFILKNLNEGSLLLHFNGSYHSDNYEGISWYINTYRDNLSIITISAVRQKDISRLEAGHIQKADYIICVPEDMTTSY